MGKWGRINRGQWLFSINQGLDRVPILALGNRVCWFGVGLSGRNGRSVSTKVENHHILGKRQFWPGTFFVLHFSFRASLLLLSGCRTAEKVHNFPTKGTLIRLHRRTLMGRECG